jgi:uncharacterized membrane protein
MSPFDWRSVLLAKHAQHVVLIHFPIALFIAAVVFDMLMIRWQRRELAAVVYYNLLGAAVFVIPAVLTGLLAWQIALEGHRLKGALLLHLLFGMGSAIIIMWSWWVHYRAREAATHPPRWRIPLEIAGVLLLMATGHLGGLLTGVNGPV